MLECIRGDESEHGGAVEDYLQEFLSPFPKVTNVKSVEIQNRHKLPIASIESKSLHVIVDLHQLSTTRMTNNAIIKNGFDLTLSRSNEPLYCFFFLYLTGDSPLN